jgi:aspartyl-tRNA(Asn)/glutamyl-tRNA(Gln) amidotransferase subunit B
MLREARESLPELPATRLARYAEMGLADNVALTLATDPETADYFERAAAAADGAEPKVVGNWVIGELAAALRLAEVEGGAADSKVAPESLAALVGLVGSKKISHGSAKIVLGIMVAEGGDPEQIVEREGLAQMSDSGEIEAVVETAMADNPGAVEKIREGNPKAIGAIVGAVMRETKGRADGGEVNRIIQERINS